VDDSTIEGLSERLDEHSKKVSGRKPILERQSEAEKASNDADNIKEELTF
jgi:hypothetical protein